MVAQLIVPDALPRSGARALFEFDQAAAIKRRVDLEAALRFVRRVKLAALQAHSLQARQ